jgi:hypothetical protein
MVPGTRRLRNASYLVWVQNRELREAIDDTTISLRPDSLFDLAVPM